MRGEKIWRIRNVNAEKIKRLEEQLPAAQPVALLLAARGISDPEVATVFLHPSLERFHDPSTMEGMTRAVSLIDEAIDSGKNILIWGHEDTDGIVSIAILHETIRDLQGKVSYYVPNRLREGHGLSESGIRKAKERGIDLIVTVDCGISNVDPATAAGELGVKLAITDHHEILGSLPGADAVVDPKRPDCKYPFKELAGCGVAFKLAQSLVKTRLGLDVRQWLDSKPDVLGLAVLGTISDKVPLLDENRILAKFGLKALLGSQRPGIRAIREKAPQYLGKEPTPMEIIRVAVQILSSGRSERGENQGCELLLTDDLGRAEELVGVLLRASQRWQEEAKRAYMKAARSVGAYSTKRMLVVVDEESPCYLLGYCASRLKEDHGKPVVAIGFRGDIAIGECRGPKWFDFVDCLKSCGELFVDYGGHKQAAGFSILPSRVADFRKALDAYCASGSCNGESERPILWIDGELPLSDLSAELTKSVSELAPFGEGNPPPLFVSTNANLDKREGGYVFDPGGRELFIRKGSPVGDWTNLSGDLVELDVAYSIDETGGLVLRDCRPSAFSDLPEENG